MMPHMGAPVPPGPSQTTRKEVRRQTVCLECIIRHPGYERDTKLTFDGCVAPAISINLA